MARKITSKQVQEIVSCSCGHTSVDHIDVHVKYKDFSKARIRRKIDKGTGKPFLVMNVEMECEGGACHFDY